MKLVDRIERISAPNTANPRELAVDLPNERRKSASYMGRARSAEARRACGPLNLRKTAVTKRDEEAYCYLSAEYAELADEVKRLQRRSQNGQSAKGLSPLTVKRRDLKAQILREKPFGEILEALEVQ
jgi:hypothetical protein